MYLFGVGVGEGGDNYGGGEYVGRGKKKNNHTPRYFFIKYVVTSF